MSENLALKERVSQLEKGSKGRSIGLIAVAMVLCLNIYLLYSKQTFSGRWMAINDRNGHIRRHEATLCEHNRLFASASIHRSRVPAASPVR